MDAKAKSLREILHSGDQFLIPYFQRFYAWKRANWERLQSDVWMLFQDPSRRQHFLGPLVCASLRPVPGEIHTFQLIDGQQRLTTLSLLLTALRDVAGEQGDEELAQEVTETFLLHRFKRGLQRFKIVPRVGDREAFCALVERKSPDPKVAPQLVEAHEYFRKAIRAEVHGQPQKLRQLFETIVGRLYLVVITLDEENPYEIFESLNSTGLPLEESDLIRNFLFMQLPVDQHAEFQEEHWEPYESMFEAVGDHPAVSATAFYRDFLMRQGTYSRAKATFVDFKRYFESSKLLPQQAVAELTRYGRYMLALTRRGVGQPPLIAKQLTQFDLLDASTANPLLLNLLNRHENGAITEAQLSACLTTLSSFIIRRSICGESTRAYGRWFCEVIPKLGDDTLRDLEGYLLHRGWPDDETFQRRLVEFPVYRREFKKCRLMLEAIEESYGHKEAVKLTDLQIEHILPQTIPRGKDGATWREMLGKDAVKVHEQWLHTLGNLTLTGYNPTLSNKPFAIKQVEFANSKLSMSSGLSKLAAWNTEAILQRGEELAKRVTSLWPRPKGGDDYRPHIVLPISPKPGRDRRESYWTKFIELLALRKSPWLPLQASIGTNLDVPVPASDVSLIVQLNRPKSEIRVRLQFERLRGKQIFAALFEERAVIESDFHAPFQWTDGAVPEITAVLPSSTIRDPLDWLDQHEWIADRLAEVHRGFHQRLERLNAAVVESNPHKQMLLAYWAAFERYLKQAGSTISGTKPLPQVWNNFGIGRSNVHLATICNCTEQRIAINLTFTGKHARYYFEQLEAKKEKIEKELGCPVEWYAPIENKHCKIILRQCDTDPADPRKWTEQHAWLLARLEQFRTVFQPHLKILIAPEE